MFRTTCRVILMLVLWAGSVHASDVKTYIYDAQGRVIAVARTRDTVTAGYSAYRFDDADNRLNRQLQNAAPRQSQNELRPGEVLVPQSSLVALDGRSTVVMQADGNVVLYFGSTPLWSTATGFGRSLVLGMQSDGNLVLYDPSFQALWASNTPGQPGARAILQNDCNLVILSTGGAVLWASGTQC